MKFPKWNHPWLCQQLLYLPAYLLLLLAPIGAVLLEACGIDVPGIPFLIVFFILGGCAIWYLFSQAPFLISVDLLSAEIHAWQRDRLEYRSRINGLTREDAARRILRRCRFWGLKRESSDGRFTVCCRHGYSWTKFRSMIEQRLVLCQTEHLSPEEYRLLLAQARHILSKLPDGVIRFQDKATKRMPRAYASLVVILADRVDEAVKTQARELDGDVKDRCILPCVAECPTGCYYMNGGKEDYEIGMMGRPARNYARGLARRLVFAFGLPLENRDKRPPCELKEIMDMSLWEFLRTMNAEMRETKTGQQKEQQKMVRRLSEGEVRMGEYAIYCKVGGRVAAWAYLPDEAEETRVSLLPGNTWYYQKKSGVPLLGGDYPRRKMKPRQIEDVDRRIRSWLIANGYRIEEDALLKQEEPR
ncbi:MAG: hypothetical protein IKT99_01340 [Oscillospiraceae bacterium]|nr:hypothetical protein [Oscillospiraceae bacterium]